LSRRVNRKYMNRESTRKRRVQKTLGLHYSRFYVIALCIDSRFRHKILENCSQAAPVEKVGLIVGDGSDWSTPKFPSPAFSPAGAGPWTCAMVAALDSRRSGVI